MTKKMLIDAHQPEETRVVLLNGNKIEEFDYENNSLAQLKGNVYLARVTRVEPSLQAAFVEYGGNRQGFLAFSEIHPDYYRIPVEDREALEADAEVSSAAEGDDSTTADAEPSDDNEEASASNNAPEELGGDDEHGDRSQSSESMMRRYKIQEVITRKQILLVQVVKEERGNKGAALTTYLSLAGRYCVLMPNSNRGGGVSRKITNVADRKRLKSVVSDLDVPKGMAVIVRTAGSKRTKTEIKRDYAYLSKLWNEIRSKTLQSEAPALIHEEGSLVKRAVRDMYTNDVEEVLIEGEDSYKVAKAQMKMLIPSHAKRVTKYEGTEHLFQNYGIEPQLDTIHQGEVTLKSGGYLVINQTEALVAIDVNSGKATRERNIEETALKTNLEAAEEVGRQLKLRDLSGLIVIDFIDMEENRNKSAIERKLKDALRHDRARIQVGSISHFGLLEMSRQRLRPSLAESVSQTCPHCAGTGRIRSINSAALQILRVVEEEAGNRPGQDISIFVHPDVALYILNQKRASLASLEQQFGISILIEADSTLIPPDYRLGGEHAESGARSGNNGNNGGGRSRGGKNNKSARNQNDQGNQKPAHPEAEGDGTDDEDEQPKRKRRGRRGGRRRKKRGNEDGTDVAAQTAPEADNAETEAKSEPEQPSQDSPDTELSEQKVKKPRRRAKTKAAKAEATAQDDKSAEVADKAEAQSPADDAAPAKKQTKAKKKTAAGAAKKTKAKKPAAKAGTKKAKTKTSPPEKEASQGKEQAKPAASGQNDGATDTAADRSPKSSVEMNVINIDEAPSAEKKKKGWWSR